MLNRSTTTLLVGLIFVSSLLPAQQTHVPIKPSPSVKQFFDDLLRYGTSRLPKPEVALQIADHMNDINPARIREALPSIVAALEVSDNTVHTYAAEALIGISFRSDSADLLTKYSDYIGALLGSPDTEVQNAAVSIISNLKPAPPPELVSSLMNFVEREDRDLQAQTSAVFFLVRFAPKDPRITLIVEKFFSRTMDGNSKINALNVVGTRTIQDSRIIAKVIVFLDDSNPAVQQAAISSLTRMGDHALIQATPALNRVVLRPGEPEPVRQSAVQALNAIRR